MTYHSEFWMVAGAAAPVIALANVVPMSSTFLAVSKDMDTWANWLVYVLSAANITVQAYVLSGALYSLAEGRDTDSLRLVTSFEMIGLILVLGVAAFSAIAKPRPGAAAG
jgi:hypothetical protein